jgi:hypothetical protein
LVSDEDGPAAKTVVVVQLVLDTVVGAKEIHFAPVVDIIIDELLGDAKPVMMLMVVGGSLRLGAKRILKARPASSK